MPERNIRCTLAYDGTDFKGWQSQKDKYRTVQGVVEKALAKMHSRRIPVYASGRTDTGVHAIGQTINFKTDLDSISAEQYAVALTYHLPVDITVWRSEEVDASFHSRYDACAREYRYYIHTSPPVFPHQRLYCHSVREGLDISCLNRCASFLVGTHDFSSFTLPSDESDTKVRRIYSAAFYPEGPFCVFRIAGSGFLRRMVRMIIGSILRIYMQDGAVEQMREILEACDPGTAGDSAPAKGLFLYKVYYDAEQVPY